MLFVSGTVYFVADTGLVPFDPTEEIAYVLLRLAGASFFVSMAFDVP